MGAHATLFGDETSKMLSIRGLLAAVCLLAQSFAAQAQEAAIARCSATGVVAVGKGNTLSAAGASAAANCEQGGGERYCCEIVADTQYAQCIAYAQSEFNEATGYGETPEQAKADALAICGSDCRPIAAPCRY